MPGEPGSPVYRIGRQGGRTRKGWRGFESLGGRVHYEITENSTGRQVVTTEQAAAARGITVASMRKDIARRIARGAVTWMLPLDRRTPVYYPEDLGLEEP